MKKQKINKIKKKIKNKRNKEKNQKIKQNKEKNQKIVPVKVDFWFVISFCIGNGIGLVAS